MPLIQIQKIAELNNPVHPKNIEIGHTAVGQLIDYPRVGQRFVVGNSFITSLVSEIIDYDTFATMNSVYRVIPIRSIDDTEF